MQLLFNNGCLLLYDGIILLYNIFSHSKLQIKMSAELKIKSIYDDELTKRQQKECRQKFMETFNVSESRFYAALTDNNIPAIRLKFFAGLFNCSMEYLYTKGSLGENGISKTTVNPKFKIALVKG